MLEQLDTPEALQAKLTEILVAGPLYRVFGYQGQGGHQSYASGKHYGHLPKQLKMFCGNDRCEQDTWWDVDSQVVGFGSEFINHRRYRCRNCGDSAYDYYFIWQEREKDSVF